MSEEDHGIDVEEDTDLDTADDDEQEMPDEVEQEMPDEVEQENPDREPGRDDADSQVREEEAADQENVDNHRDEEPFES